MIMWTRCWKQSSIERCSKGLPLLKSLLPLTFTNLQKAYFCDFIYSNEKGVNCISENFVKPKYKVEQSKQPYYLGPFDIAVLPCHYVNFGLLYAKPSHLNGVEFSIHSFLKSLKESLSLTLVHFYPLAGQLASEVDEDKHESRVYVDCNKGPGVKFIHATLDMTIYDIISPKYVPLIVRSFFDLSEVVNYDGHTNPLLSIQVTELLDGFFIACSINHCLTDGISYWQFWSIWSKIHRAYQNQTCESHFDRSRLTIDAKVTHLPVYNRWYPDGRNPGPYAIPFIHRDDFLRKYETPHLRERIFHFSSSSIARLKAKANKQSHVKNISSFQALCAHIWRSIIRANSLQQNQIIYHHMPSNSRGILKPPLPTYYFGNFIQPLSAITTSNELLENDLGWAASRLNELVVNHNDRNLRNFIDNWLKSPYCYSLAVHHGYNNSVSMGNSPRFDVYGNEFGLGKAIAFRTGLGNKCNGVVFASKGREEEGSVDLEICMSGENMSALEEDEEFLEFVHS